MSEKRIALVTGASRGIGASILMQLAESGCQVIGTATRPEGADAITERLQAAGLSGRGLALNVTDLASIEAALESIHATEGAPTVLVNNAAITRDNLFLRMKETEWDEVIQANLTGIYRMSKAVIKGMTKARFGRIVSISSVSGVIGNAGQTNYSAAKAGLIGFSKALAQEVAARNITVNVVAPGLIETDMARQLPEAHRQQFLDKIPMKRMGQPDEIAAAVTFLASDSASYVTGTVLHVNGGMVMV